MKSPVARAVQIFVAVTSIAAWLHISNHCALALLVPSPDPAVHQHCHSDADDSDKKQSEETLPCCNILRAVVAQTLETGINIDKLWQPADYEAVVPAGLIVFDHTTDANELDTGPPFAASFAELILQRSLLAHAPPLFV